jgi:hypothetical protein
MKKPQQVSPVAGKYPNGFSVLAHALRMVITGMNSASRPIELWTPDEFDQMRKNIREFFRDTRNEYNAASWGQKAANNGHIATREENAVIAKTVRAHLRLIEPEAIRATQILRDRVLSPRTRDAMLGYLHAWHESSLDPNIPPRVLGRTLRDLLESEHLEIPSDPVSRQILEAFERADFNVDDDKEWPTASGGGKEHDGRVDWQYELMPRDTADERAQLILPAPDLAEKTRAAMVAYARGLGDRESDLLALLMVRFAEQAKHTDDRVWIQLDYIMQALGYSKKRGGGDGETYGAADKAAVREQINRLEGGFLTIRKAGTEPGKRRREDLESRVLAFWQRFGGQIDLDGRQEWTQIQFSFGRTWASRLFGKQARLTALLQAQAIRYDATKERYEKRILKRLAWYWKMNNYPSATAPRTVLEWVRDDVGDEDHLSYRRRDAERLEAAFDRLKSDGHIADWAYRDGAPRVSATEGAMVHRWLERWLEREIVVEAPENIRLANTAIRAPKAAALPAPSPADDDQLAFGKRVRAFRIRLGITALAAAKNMGMDNSTLSRLETGKRVATPEQRRQIEAWMATLKNRPDKRHDLHK